MRKVSKGVLMTGVSVVTALATAPVSAYASDLPSVTEQSAETEALSELRDPSIMTDYGVPEPEKKENDDEQTGDGNDDPSHLPDTEWQRALVVGVGLVAGAGMVVTVPCTFTFSPVFCVCGA